MLFVTLFFCAAFLHEPQFLCFLSRAAEKLQIPSQSSSFVGGDFIFRAFVFLDFSAVDSEVQHVFACLCVLAL